MENKDCNTVMNVNIEDLALSSTIVSDTTKNYTTFNDVVNAGKKVNFFNFEKISYNQYLKDWKKLYGEDINEDVIKDIYDNIKIPERSTRGSAGYDFYSPFDFTLSIGANIIIPTGIRFVPIMDSLKNMANKSPHYDVYMPPVCCIVPRSSLGTKYGISLVNTVGVIDPDYCNSDNEGHIMINLEMRGKKEPLRMSFNNKDIYTKKEFPIYSKTEITINAGDKICQGLVLCFTHLNENGATRNGGFGSTGK